MQQDKKNSLEQCKVLIIKQFAANAMQAACRGFKGRRRVKSILGEEANNQRLEVQGWSVGIIQRIARGMIARRNIVKARKVSVLTPTNIPPFSNIL